MLSRVALAWLLLQAPPELNAALELERAGKPQEALSALATVPTLPGSPLAGRVLYERARLTDERLRDPLGAARLYGEYLSAFPDGSYAKLSQDRREYLLRNGSVAPEALAEYEEILHRFAVQPAPELEARMAAVVERFPAFPLRPRACFWLANLSRQRHDYAGANRWLMLVMRDYPGSGDAHRAELAQGQDAVAQNRFADGLAVFRRYLDSDDALARELARAQLSLTLNRRLWYWLFRAGVTLLAGSLALLALGLWRRRAPLRPLPFEVRLIGPVAAVLALLTFVENRRVGVAVALILGGGLLFATLQGAYLRVASPRGLRRLLHVAVSAGAAASLAFCAIDGCGLTDLVITTIEQGADR